jgi:hypothetical protein
MAAVTMQVAAVLDWLSSIGKIAGKKLRKRPFSVAADFFPFAGRLDGRSNKSNGYILMFLL